MHMYVYSMYVYTNVCMTQLDTLCMSLFVVPAELHVHYNRRNSCVYTIIHTAVESKD